jgi:hypothetical protein
MDSFNVPPCDPNWDYANQWELVHGMKHRLEELIKQMKTFEDATPESNQLIHEEVETTINTEVACINLTDFHPSNLKKN